MPASSKMLKNKEQAKNRAAGIGDETGRMPSRVKAEEVNLKCNICFKEIRKTKLNVEAATHCKSLHPTVPFTQCFPGCPDPGAIEEAAKEAAKEGGKIDVDFIRAEAAKKKSLEEGGTVKVKGEVKPKKKKEDLSFLDAGLK
jgi:hypothetical protein